MKRKILVIVSLLSCLSFFSVGFCYEKIFFEGKINLKDSKLNLNIKLPSDTKDSKSSEISFIKVVAHKKNREDLFLSWDIRRLNTPFLKFSGKIRNSLKLNFEKGISLLGDIKGESIFLDKKEIRQAQGQFSIKDKKFYISSLFLDEMKCEGSINLLYPYSVNMLMRLHDLPVDDFLNFWVKNKSYTAQGSMSGDIKILGSLKKLYLRGNFTSYHGLIKSLAYNNIFVNIEGFFPYMQITNTRLDQKNGFIYRVQGPLVLNEKRGFKKQLEELDISPLTTQSESHSEWTLKQTGQNPSSVTQLKYLLRDTGNSHQEKSDMFVVERRMEF